jgi:hypothetical protein
MISRMSITTDEFVGSFVAEMTGKDVDLDRLVTQPSGLTIGGMIEAMYHPSVGRLAIPLLADFMAPQGSVYYDAIFGAYYGQLSIRRWLVPAMADIEFIDFVPTAATVVIDDGLGGTWLDEWQMVMNLEGETIPLSRGVSVRRYRDGWLIWACDVYDTAAFRQPAPPEMDVSTAPELPPCPQVEWETDASVQPSTLADPRRTAGPFHPTESVYFDPIAGELHGEAAITAWIERALGEADVAVFEPLGPLLSDGHTTVQEWKRSSSDEGGDGTVLRGTSVRRVVDGLTVYAADYYDSAVLIPATA